jgi:hypothetical protein
MFDWKIELRNVGKTRASKTILVSAANLVGAKQQALRECRKYLTGGSLYLEAKGHYTYTVLSGLDEVGEVRILRLD